MEAESGSIEVDGLNTREMGTEDLRSRFSIIPQVGKGERERDGGHEERRKIFRGETKVLRDFTIHAEEIMEANRASN